MLPRESPDVDSSESNLRTPLQLVLKTITTHAFALASYTFLCALLRRPSKTHLQAVRCLFLLFVPTLVLVELLVTVFRSALQFLRDYEDDDEDMHFIFYLAAAIGMHAQLRKGDEESSKDVKDRNIQLLDVGSHAAEKEAKSLSWTWAGKMLVVLFALTQAIGTIIMWARRCSERATTPLGFDHRNGAIGIASTICGTICILILLMRREWKVSKVFEPPSKNTTHFGMASPRNQFVAEALLAMLLHLAIATSRNTDNVWLYSSVGSIAWLIVSGDSAKAGWPSLILIVFLYIFRRDIARKFGVDQNRYTKISGGKRVARVRALLGFLLVIWITTDVVWLFVVDIVQVVNESRRERYHNAWGYVGCWWQDPLSDSLIVI